MRYVAIAACLGVVASVHVLGGCHGVDQPLPRLVTGWAVGSAADGYGAIINTTDGGATWVRQGSETTIPNVSLSNVTVVDAQCVWAVGGLSDGYGVILHTTDGGQSWVRQGAPGEIPDTELLGASAVDANTAWVAGDGGTVLRTTNGGQTWQQKDTGFSDAAFGAITAVDENTAWAVGNCVEEGAQRILIVKTIDGGATWTPQGSRAVLGSISLIDAHAPGGEVAWAVGTEYTVAYTTTGGYTWANVPPSPNWNHLNGVHGIGEQTAWVAGDYNLVFRTTDAGRTWDEFVPPTRHGTTYIVGVSALNANNACFVGSDVVHADDKAYIAYTTDGGTTWVDARSPANSWLRRVAFAEAPR